MLQIAKTYLKNPLHYSDYQVIRFEQNLTYQKYERLL